MADAQKFPLHQAYWFLKQLHQDKTPNDSYLNFRCIHNCKPFIDSLTGKTVLNTKPTFDTFVKAQDFKAVWENELLQKLLLMNSGQEPSNIYFAVNAMIEKGHKKEHFKMMNVLHLDMDANSKYTKDQRWLQMEFWKTCGYYPSIVNHSGNGYHAYWVLKKPITKDQGEAILKRMVALADCKEGGNTWDVSRVLRLPGFMNVKKWYEGDTPPCAIVHPENWQEIKRVEEFDAEFFEGFPPSSRDQIEAYVSQARSMCKDGTDFNEKMQEVLQGVNAAVNAYAAQQAGQALAMQNQAADITPQANPTFKEFTPRMTIVPHSSDVKWPRKLGWAKKYCQVGYDRLTQGEQDEIKMKLNTDDCSASTLDFYIIQALVDKGYTKDAVREFWIRPDHKLHRADKEAKNPNYFDMSYDKALGYAKARHLEQANSASHAEEIFIKDHRTMLVKGDSSETVMTAEFKLNAVYIDRDATDPAKREYYDITAISQDSSKVGGIIEYELFVARDDFNKLDGIRKHSQETLCYMASSVPAIQKALHHMLTKYRNAPVFPFHSKLVYAKGEYIYPSFTVTKDEIIRRDEQSPHLEKMLKALPFFGGMNVSFWPHEMIVEQLREHWGRTLSMHLPTVVCSVIGHIAGTMIAPLFQEKLGINNFHIPTLNIRGSSNTAKTETVSHLFTLTGIKRGANTLSVASSEFGISQTMSKTNFLPILIDEFKEDNNQNLKQIRQLIRRIYSGESILKGRADLSVQAAQNHASAIILGETAVEHIGDVSEVSRILPIDTSAYRTDDGYKNWMKIEHIQWCELAPLFAQYLLRQDVSALYKEFEEIKKQVAEDLVCSFSTERFRVAHNVAVVVFGCHVYDRFILSIDQTLPTIEAACHPYTTLVEYIKEWAITSGHTLVVETPDGSKESKEEIGTILSKQVKIFSKNEFFDLLHYYSTILSTEITDKFHLAGANAFLFRVNETKNELFIHFDTLYGICLRQKNLDRQTIYTKEKYLSVVNAAAKRQENWVVDKSRVTKTDAKITKRCLVLALSDMRQMGIWPNAEMLPASNGDGSETDPKTPCTENRQFT
jgi:hypothetical protein